MNLYLDPHVDSRESSNGGGIGSTPHGGSSSNGHGNVPLFPEKNLVFATPKGMSLGSRNDGSCFTKPFPVFDACTDGMKESCNGTTSPVLSASSSSNHQKKQYSSSVDPLLARELSELTVEERERLYEEIHGCTQTSNMKHVQDEETEFRLECLQQMEYELSKMRNRMEYNLAHFLAPSKVKDMKFRLQFLRAENYDPKKAAKRIITHYKHKATLFGIDKVADTITLDDLTEDDKLALYSGGLQVLPLRDKAGRTVFFFSPKHDNFKTWQNQVRYYYLLTLVSRVFLHVLVTGLLIRPISNVSVLLFSLLCLWFVSINLHLLHFYFYTTSYVRFGIC